MRARKLDETLYFRATVVIGSAHTSSYNCSRLTRVSFVLSITAPIDTEYNVLEIVITETNGKRFVLMNITNEVNFLNP